MVELNCFERRQVEYLNHIEKVIRSIMTP